VSPAGTLDEAVLDDPQELERLDPGEMLRAVATAGAQVRETLLRIEPDLLTAVSRDDRPRAVVVAGMGASGIVAEVAAAVAGRTCPVPVLSHRRHRLPGWVGPMDLVVAVSCSGRTPETLSAADEALRRGCRVVTVGAAGSPLAARSDGGRALHVPVDAAGRQPRANLWGLAIPVLMVLDAVGLADVPAGVLSGLADELDGVSERCGPAVESIGNPAKTLALALGGTLPYLWGGSDVATVAAARFADQLAENAKYPAVHGPLTEVHHNQVVVLAGAFGALAGDPADDLFRDRVEDAPGWPRMRLLVLRDTDEVPEVAARADASPRLAERYGVLSSELRATGAHPVLRLASLVAPLDFASVYLALAQGIDPTPVEPIDLLERGRYADDADGSDREDGAR
jgi:glucose/mannose-6-phosphate isomerase